MKSVNLFIAVLFAVLFLFLLTSCGDTSVILDNSDKNYFEDFYTKGDKVYIECVLNLVNTSDSPKKVKISAYDTDNVETGLLKEPVLVAVNRADGKDRFTIAPGENQISVVFTGDYAGVYQIYERQIPRFVVIEQ